MINENQPESSYHVGYVGYWRNWLREKKKIRLSRNDQDEVKLSTAKITERYRFKKMIEASILLKNILNL